MIVLYFLCYFYRNKQNSYAALTKNIVFLIFLKIHDTQIAAESNRKRKKCSTEQRFFSITISQQKVAYIMEIIKVHFNFLHQRNRCESICMESRPTEE